MQLILCIHRIYLTVSLVKMTTTNLENPWRYVQVDNVGLKDNPYLNPPKNKKENGTKRTATENQRRERS